MLLDIQHLSIAFHSHRGVSCAVNDLSFQLAAGESLGIVGESGSGKSVSSLALLGLLPKASTKIDPRSRAIFQGRDLLQLTEKELRPIRGRDISFIFQDPMTCLNPTMRIGDQVAEPLVLHQGLSWKEARKRAIEELDRTGIPNARERARCYPHEFSGGMRQRVMIAMALITRPALLIADEPTTALDVRIQKQVLDLLRERQRELGTAILIISHDLDLVRAYTERIQVMYAGSIVESAPTEELINHPAHAYTRALLASNPAHCAKDSPLTMIPGMARMHSSPPTQCSFRERNTLGDPELCLLDRAPQLIELRPGHRVQDCPGCLAGHH